VKSPLAEAGRPVFAAGFRAGWQLALVRRFSDGITQAVPAIEGIHSQAWPRRDRYCSAWRRSGRVISEVVMPSTKRRTWTSMLDGIHKALKKVLYAENCFVALHNHETDTFSFPFFADQVDVAPPPQKVRP